MSKNISYSKNTGVSNLKTLEKNSKGFDSKLDRYVLFGNVVKDAFLQDNPNTKLVRPMWTVSKTKINLF
jgi:hypothetical protein